MKEKVQEQKQKYQEQFDKLLEQRDSRVAQLKQTQKDMEQDRGECGALEGLEEEDEPADKKDKK